MNADLIHIPFHPLWLAYGWLLIVGFLAVVAFFKWLDDRRR